MGKFFVEAADVGEGTILLHKEEDIRHISRVLRLSPGDVLDISDSCEWEYKTSILSITDRQIELKILDKQRFAREPQLAVTLFQGIPKQSKMDLVVQKCVEMGVYRIVPLFTERTIVTDKGNFQKKRQRWQKVSAESVKQCKRGIIPQIETESTLDQMIEAFDQFDLVIFPYENEEERTMKDCLRSLKEKPKRIGIIIGPEGGFSEQEAERIKAAGAECVTLGRTILRTETAGLVALTMTMYELEL